MSRGQGNVYPRPYSRVSTPEQLRFFQAAPQLYSRGWVDSDPDTLHLRKSGSSRNRTRDLWICSKELWPLDHRGCHIYIYIIQYILYIWYIIEHSTAGPYPQKTIVYPLKLAPQRVHFPRTSCCELSRAAELSGSVSNTKQRQDILYTSLQGDSLLHSFLLANGGLASVAPVENPTGN
jgi:hypothetical protein